MNNTLLTTIKPIAVGILAGSITYTLVHIFMYFLFFPINVLIYETFFEQGVEFRTTTSEILLNGFVESVINASIYLIIGSVIAVSMPVKKFGIALLTFVVIYGNFMIKPYLAVFIDLKIELGIAILLWLVLVILIWYSAAHIRKTKPNTEASRG